MPKNDLGHIVSDSKDSVQLYVKFKLEHAKLHLAEKMTLLSTYLVSRLIMSIMFMLFFVFGSVALGLFLATLMPTYWAFLIIAGVYLLSAPLMYLFRNILVRPLLFKTILREMVLEKK